MSRLLLASQSYEESASGLPPEICVNLFPEQVNDRSEVAYVLRPTPGLEVLTDLSGAQGRGLFYSDGAPGGMLCVHDATLSSISSSFAATPISASLAGSGRVSFAASTAYTAICDPPYLYTYDGTTFAQVTDADLPSLYNIDYLAGYFVGVADDGKVYFSEPTDPTSWTALGFFSAEARADDAQQIIVDREELWITGSQSIELHLPTSSSTLPFRRRPGGVIPKGVAGRRAATAIDNTIAWVGSDRIIWRAEGVTPRRISTHGIEDKLKPQNLSAANLAAVEVSAHSWRGHAFLQVDIPTQGTFVYDAATQKWHERRTGGQALYRPRLWVDDAYGRLIAIDRSGDLIAAEESAWLDVDQAIVRMFSANAPVDAGRPSVNNLVLRGSQGRSAITGQGSDPRVMMRYSNDRGETWSAERWRSLGKIGEYNKVTRWNGLGRMRPPGRVFEFSYSDPIGFIVRSVHMNEADAP